MDYEPENYYSEPVNGPKNQKKFENHGTKPSPDSHWSPPHPAKPVPQIEGNPYLEKKTKEEGSKGNARQQKESSTRKENVVSAILALVKELDNEEYTFIRSEISKKIIEMEYKDTF